MVEPARRGSPDPAAWLDRRSPRTVGDLRSAESAGSGDPRTAGGFQGRSMGTRTSLVQAVCSCIKAVGSRVKALCTRIKTLGPIVKALSLFVKAPGLLVKELGLLVQALCPLVNACLLYTSPSPRDG